MEGIKEAIAYITGLAVKAEKPETIEINGRTYCTKDLRRYDAADKPSRSKRPLSPLWWTISRKAARNSATE